MTIHELCVDFGVDDRSQIRMPDSTMRPKVREWLRSQGVRFVSSLRLVELEGLANGRLALSVALKHSDINNWRREVEGTPAKPVEIEAEVTPAPEAPKPAAGPQDQKVAEAAKVLQDLFGGKQEPALNEAEIRRIAKDAAVKPGSARPLEVKRWDNVVKPIGVQHFMFPLLLKAIEAELHVALVGPAGTGKTTAGEKVAEALGLNFHIQSFCRQTTKSDLLGFKDAHGNYQTTPFRRWFQDGGVFIGDEWDAGNENANLIVNASYTQLDEVTIST